MNIFCPREEYYEYHESREDLARGQVDELVVVGTCAVCGCDIFEDEQRVIGEDGYEHEGCEEIAE